jgi:hypothetical protein
MIDLLNGMFCGIEVIVGTVYLLILVPPAVLAAAFLWKNIQGVSQ